MEHGPSLMFSIVCICESIEGVQKKGGFSAAAPFLTYYNRRDMSTLVLHGKVLGSMAEPLNVVFLLSVAFNELADASRSEKVSILSQCLNCAAACGRTECSPHLVRMKGRVIAAHGDIVQVFCGRFLAEISRNTQQTCAWRKYTHSCSSVCPPRFSFKRVSAFFPSSFFPPCHRPSLPPQRQRLSWPPVTQTQAPLSRQHSVVRMKWCMFIFRCVSFKTISNELTGRLVLRLLDNPDSAVLGGTARRPFHHPISEKLNISAIWPMNKTPAA